MAGIDPRDAILQAHVPAVMVPRFSTLGTLDHSGHRYLVAEDGLWIEVRRPWLLLTWPVVESPVPMPYGQIKDSMEFAWVWEDLWTLMEHFREEARQALPNEHAAWFVWDEHARALKYFPLVVGKASPARIELIRTKLATHEHLAVDIHSHGTLPACFSATDDKDDAGEVKLSVVLGNLDDPAAETQAMRLCAHGLFIPFEDADETSCRICGCTNSAPCAGGCSWTEPDLCSACAAAAES